MRKPPSPERNFISSLRISTPHTGSGNCGRTCGGIRWSVEVYTVLMMVQEKPEAQSEFGDFLFRRICLG
jgi:hypothetical protein